jgi:hypothetical protein
MILNEKGELADGYNTTGNFYGTIFKSFESKNSSGQTTVMLMGSFYRFNEQSMGSITRLVFKQ